MKLQKVALLLGLSLALTSVMACGKKDDTTKETTSKKETVTEIVTTKVSEETTTVQETTSVVEETQYAQEQYQEQAQEQYQEPVNDSPVGKYPYELGLSDGQEVTGLTPVTMVSADGCPPELLALAEKMWNERRTEYVSKEEKDTAMDACVNSGFKYQLLHGWFSKMPENGGSCCYFKNWVDGNGFAYISIAVQ